LENPSRDWVSEGLLVVQDLATSIGKTNRKGVVRESNPNGGLTKWFWRLPKSHLAMDRLGGTGGT